MYLCGRHVLRVHVPKPSSCHFGSRGKLLDPVQRIAIPTSTLHHEIPQKRLLPPRRQPADIFSVLCDVGKNPRSLETDRTISSTELYTELRRQSLHSVARLPAATYSNILEEAYRAHSELIDIMCNDIAKFYLGTDQERTNLLHSILENADLSKMQPNTLVLAVDKLADKPSASVIGKFVRFIVDTEGQAMFKPLVQRLHALIMDSLLQYRVPSGARALVYRPPALVHTALLFTFKLVTSSENHFATELFHILYQRGFIPSGLIHDNIAAQNDSNAVIPSSLIRTSIHWGWRPLAVKMLLHLLRISQPDNQLVFELAVDTSYALLNPSIKQDVRSLTPLFREMHRLAPIPATLVRQFYNSTAEHMLGEEAAAFYSFSRSPDVMKQHQYPAPQGMALTWLMHHLATASKKTYLSRILAAEVVESNLLLVPQFRARFICLTASMGYSSLARELWSQYSFGKDKHLVIGNSALMLRMTSLYAYLIRRTNQKLQHANNDEQRELLASQLQDLVAFRDFVLWSYRKQHGSLKEAPHNVITSLARACFIVGKVTEGLDAFKVLLKRKELPDMYDVNVILSAIAQRHPRSAASIVKQIKERGIQPDAVCYATVMHFAHMHNDKQLVLQMMHHLRGLDRKQLSLKSVAALIRMSLAFTVDGTKASRHQILQDVMDIIMKLTENKFLASPQTGKYLVITSLREDDPVMAYRFWYLLLREGADWKDTEQVYQRRLVSHRIRLHCSLGRLKREDAEPMLRRLKGAPGVKR
ncbi:hypothetical protein M378DRAFT_122067 [Amanita muscaria Koide BX008]|uniref:Uncharacterized protein n=1 Tax=Amanita muscaria (strain Koide BX008) TaxID=946122 RepID=A0A0C2TL82_AMAMK|nr:hypothetical protein M378DRAFT_122067 [Amanita muscaria Koide BX008]